MLTKLYAISSSPRDIVGIPVALTVISSIIQGIGLVLIAPFLSSLLDNQMNEAAKWLLVMCGVLLLYGVVQFFAQKYCYQGGMKLMGELFENLSKHIVTLPLSWFEGSRVGTVCQTMSKGIIDVMAVPAHYFRPIIGAFVTPATVIIFMLFYDYRIGVAAFIAAPLLFITYRLTGYLAAKAEHASNKAAEEVNSRVIEFAVNQAMLRAYDKDELGYNILKNALSDEKKAGHNLLKTTLPAMLGFSVSIQIFFSMIIGLGLYLVMEDSISLAALITLLILTARFIEPMNLAADLGGSVRIAENMLQRMVDIMSTPSLPESQSKVKPIIPAEVEIDNVQFSYGNNSVLRGISFKSTPGSITALVGPSGSGKSTLLHLVARFWDVSDGNIRIGGVDVRDMPFSTLMNNISFVFQHVYLFDGTIADNIRIGDENCTPNELSRVMELAGINEMLERFPLKEHTQVGEGGTALSGGEKQRIAIARAILKKSSILLLDEVTAALDFENQLAIQNAISSLRSTHTIIIIAHRLQTIKNADQIIVLNSQGGIDAMGKHERLIKENGLYSEFWKLREETFSWHM